MVFVQNKSCTDLKEQRIIGGSARRGLNLKKVRRCRTKGIIQRGKRRTKDTQPAVRCTRRRGTTPMLRAALHAAVIILFSFAVAGCGGNSHNPAANKSPGIKNSGAPRIISAAPSNTEIIIGLGMGENLIAVDRYSQDIPGVPPGLPEIDFFYPDIEAIIGLEPDIIFVNEINNHGSADNALKFSGGFDMKIIQVITSTSIEGIYNDIIFIAETLGVKERGERIVQSMKDEVAGIAAAAKGRPARTVYFEVAAAPSMVSFGRGTYLNDMIEIAGGRNIFADENGWFSPGAEEILNRNPGVILVMGYPGEDPAAEIKSRRAFEGISALKENRVYSINADSASRPSQNILTAFRQIAAALNSR